MKKIGFLLAFVWGSLFSLQAWAVDFKVGKFSYDIVSMPELTVSVVGIDAVDGDEVTIPEMVEFKGRQLKVVELGYGAVTVNLAKLTIPKTVNKLGYNSIRYSCSLIEKLVLEDADEPLFMDEVSDKDNYYRYPLFFYTAVHEAYVGRNVTYDRSPWLTSDLKKLTMGRGLTCLDGAFIPREISEFTIPDHIKVLGHNVFEGCGNLTSIVVPATVDSMASGVFSSCRNLKKVTFLNRMTKLPSSTFSRCSGLKQMDLPETVTALGAAAFSECTGLETFVCPKGLTEIGEGCFQNCSSLKYFGFSEGLQKMGSHVFVACKALKSVQMPDELVSVGEHAFNGCTALKAVKLPKHMKYVGRAMFMGCSALEEVEMPEVLESVPEYAFNGCESLTSIVLPPTVTYFQDRAFHGTGLTDITVRKAEGDFGWRGQPFTQKLYVNCTLHVPTGAKAIYVADPIWSNFWTIQEEDLSLAPQYTMFLHGAQGGVLGYGLQEVYGQQADFGVKQGDEVVLQVTPLEGYRVASFLENGVEKKQELVDGRYTFRMSADKRLEVAFEYDAESGIGHPVTEAVKVYPMAEGICVDGAHRGDPICVYTMDGRLVHRGVATAERMVVPVERGPIYVVKVGGLAVKVR